MSLSLKTTLLDLLEDIKEDSKSRLVPSTPWNQDRYRDWKIKSRPGNMLIRPGLFSYAKEPEPAYLPLGWSSYVQPEGKLYFARDISPRVVTDSYMLSGRVQKLIARFTTEACERLEASGVTLPDSAELFLDLEDLEDEEEGDETCKYWFVDHASQTIFWAEETDVEDLNMVRIVSESHLRLALADHYWLYLERHPSHHCKKDLSLRVTELISIYNQGALDHLTSPTSTFMYSGDACQDIVRILQNASNDLTQPANICAIARMWTQLYHYRVGVHYGQERARLDRVQKLLPDEHQWTPRGRIFALASRALFRIPEKYADEYEVVYDDNFAYVHLWKPAITSAMDDWRQNLSWSLGLSILNALLLLVPQASGYLALSSLMLSGLAIISAFALLSHWCKKKVDTLEDAMPFFDEASKDPQRFFALAFALPRACSIWAALIMVVGQAGFILERMTNVYVPCAIALAVFLFSLPWRRWYSNAVECLPKLPFSKPPLPEMSLPWWGKCDEECAV